MKDEIKEILDIERYRNKDGYVENINLLPDEIHKLLDYITNLQEENNYYFKKNNELSSLNTSLRSDRDDYKSRNEKAKSLTNRTIEIIKQQPSGNDEWILERLNGINYCLGGDEE